MTFTRFIPAEQWSMRDDGRTIEGRIVPYNEIAEVVERDIETGELKRFQEQFLPGSCARMAQGAKQRGNASFIAFCMDHDASRDGTIGHCINLTSEDDGAYATFRLYEQDDLQKVRSMLQESHQGLSVNFADVRPPKMIDGVVSRVQVVIDHVAATPVPVYAGASITGMRSEEALTLDALGGTPELDRVRTMLDELKATYANA